MITFEDWGNEILGIKRMCNSCDARSLLTRKKQKFAFLNNKKEAINRMSQDLFYAETQEGDTVFIEIVKGETKSISSIKVTQKELKEIIKGLKTLKK